MNPSAIMDHKRALSDIVNGQEGSETDSGEIILVLDNFK